MSVVCRMHQHLLRKFSIPREITTANFTVSTVRHLDQEWRKSCGLPENPNRERILMDLPDYSFLDGRPVPYGSRQKLRILQQRKYTAKIIELTGEIDFAVARHERLKKEEEDKIQSILDKKLKPKGNKLSQK